MLYRLEQKMIPITLDAVNDTVLCAGVYRMAEMEPLLAHFGFAPQTLRELKEHHQHTVNKLDAYFGYCFGLVHEIIKQDEELSFIHIGVYFKKNLILLVCEDEKALQRFQHRLELIPNTSYSLEHVLAILLESVLAPMHPLFESIENTIMQMEEDILSMQKVTMTANIMKIRREITMLSHYFAQMMDIAEELQQDENDLFQKDQLHHIRIFADRVQRYEQSVQMLKDYIIQVRELQQSQYDLNLNRMMYVFTIVTIIFLPLTLIVGWYGMNFTTMPELTWRYGYLFVIALSLITIVGCIWYFKKKDILQ